jgi:hypothetical protein
MARSTAARAQEHVRIAPWPQGLLWVDAVEKGFLRCRPVTLIQDQEQTRNLDSKIHLPGFVRFNFQFHSTYAVTFSTVSVRLGKAHGEQMSSAHCFNNGHCEERSHVKQYFVMGPPTPGNTSQSIHANRCHQ